MLTINTNLSSLIAQNSLKSSTIRLNQAIERMTTGFKINHAKDNAANYSIATNMQTKINAYNVAADNVAMGMDLVTTASDIISNMQDKASRLQALCTQARNGTYGAQSMAAINTEAAAIMAEINRLYSTAEYNDISLFNRKAYEIADHLPQAGASGFIDETGLIATVTYDNEYGDYITNPKTYTDEEVAAMIKVSDVSTFNPGLKYSISTAEELQKVADYVNAGNSASGRTFVLAADIDLSSISNWTPIGDYSISASYYFSGTFDGNGHVIKNLKIEREKDYQGLFGCIALGAIIKNVGLENINIKGQEYVGGLVGSSSSSSSSSITNSYANGNVTGTGNYVGGLVGCSPSSTSSITNSYATATVSGTAYVGGLVGSSSSLITNSYTTGNIKGQECVGGLVGHSTSSITNSYATGTVSGTAYVGGLVGDYSSSSIINSYTTGNIKGQEYVGGLVGSSSTSSITNSYATGTISGTVYVGGLVGSSTSSITNSYVTGNVSGESIVGGLIGSANAVGCTLNIIDSVAYSTVSAVNGQSSGSLVGAFINSNRYSASTGNLILTNCQIIEQNGINRIGGVYRDDLWDGLYHFADYDMTTMLAVISGIELKNIITNLLVGINGDSSCQIGFDTNFSLNIGALGDLTSDSTLASITEFHKLLSEKSTALGAVQNRLESALDSIEVNISNLTASLSTIRDADIAQVSSEYIRQQILQQASATLLSTANQTPAIALQLI